MSGPGRATAARALRHTLAWRGVLATLLLAALSAGLALRSAKGGCRRMAKAPAAAAANPETAGRGSVAAVPSAADAAAWAAAWGESHDHDAAVADLPAGAPGACSPAVHATIAASTGPNAPAAAHAERRARAPSRLAGPPPAPPPRFLLG